MAYNDDPFFKYTVEELKNMTHEEFCALLEERNEYVRKKHSQINENIAPKFNTIEELMEYYDAIPFDEMVKEINKLLKKYGLKL